MAKDFARVRQVLMQRGMPSILFKFDDVQTTLSHITRTFIGELLFTTTAVCYTCRAKFTNLWLLQSYNPMLMAAVFLPGVILFGLLFGALALGIVGREAFGIGSVIGAIVSIPITGLAIRKINKSSMEKANRDLALYKNQNSTPDYDQILIFYWCDGNLKLDYNPNNSALVISDEWEFKIAPDEWKQKAAEVEKYCSEIPK